MVKKQLKLTVGIDTRAVTHNRLQNINKHTVVVCAHSPPRMELILFATRFMKAFKIYSKVKAIFQEVTLFVIISDSSCNYVTKQNAYNCKISG